MVRDEADAMQDQYQRSIDEARLQKDRTFCREQAVKHAKDVCRIVAMATRDEMDASTTVINSIRSTAQFAKAAIISGEFFQPDEGFGVLVAGDNWGPADMQIIRETLVRWFNEPGELSPER